MQHIWQVISSHAWMPVYLLANLAGLIMIPLGLPGLWLQFAAVLLVTLLTAHMGWVWTAAVLFLALGGEVLDRVLFIMGLKAFKASPAASWGAFLLGFVFFFFGVFIPIPIPVLGSMIGAIVMSFIGTFLGAIIGETLHQKKLAPAFRVAIGTVLGRAVGIAAKSWIAFLALCVAMVGLFWDALLKQ